MNVTLSISTKHQVITHNLVGVREEEYQRLMTELFDNPTDNKDYAYTFHFNNRLSEITFKPYYGVIVHVARQPKF